MGLFSHFSFDRDQGPLRPEDRRHRRGVRRTARDRRGQGQALKQPRGLNQETSILKDTSDLAARYDVDITTTLRANRAPEAAILREIDTTDVDLVVMGVDRIQADHLSFGGVADAVLRQSKVSVLLVSSGEARQAQVEKA